MTASIMDSIESFNIATYSITAFSTATCSIVIFSIATLSIKGLFSALSVNDTEQNKPLYRVPLC